MLWDGSRWFAAQRRVPRNTIGERKPLGIRISDKNKEIDWYKCTDTSKDICRSSNRKKFLFNDIPAIVFSLLHFEEWLGHLLHSLKVTGSQWMYPSCIHFIIDQAPEWLSKDKLQMRWWILAAELEVTGGLAQGPPQGGTSEGGTSGAWERLMKTRIRCQSDYPNWPALGTFQFDLGNRVRLTTQTVWWAWLKLCSALLCFALLALPACMTCLILPALELSLLCLLSICLCLLWICRWSFILQWAWRGGGGWWAWEGILGGQPGRSLTLLWLYADSGLKLLNSTKLGIPLHFI